MMAFCFSLMSRPNGLEWPKHAKQAARLVVGALIDDGASMAVPKATSFPLQRGAVAS
jgi:hypothetical protein